MEEINIKEIREKLNLTQQELAQEIGTTVTTISRWETGRAKPVKHLAKKIKRLLEKS